ncbi:hypothetical protein GCM10010254_11490 [Streptomyces chromofuscus]|nr:hypothetical protein GCM10010254_11490 [Streptomyces chromofuscus]
MLDGGDHLDDVGRSCEHAHGADGLVLDEPLAVRSENRGVQEPMADQDVRPGAGLRAGRRGRSCDAGFDGGASWNWAVARHWAGPPVALRGRELRLC